MARTVFLLLLLSTLLGCSKGKVQGGQGAASASVLINTGTPTDNSPNDEVIDFELTITGAALSGGSNPAVVTTTTPVEFIHQGAAFHPLALANIPNGTYSGITLNVSNATVVVVDPSSKAVTPLTPVLASSVINVPFSPAVVVSGSPLVVNLQLDLANSLTFSGTGANLTPQFTVTSSPVAVVASQDEDTGEVEITGIVTAVSGTGFTVQPSNTGQTLAFATGSNTQFKDGISSVGQIATGMIVTVQALTQSDGSLLASSVESETVSATGEQLEGLITSVTGSPVTSLGVATQSAVATAVANAPVTGTTVSAPITTSTQFSVESNHVPGPFPAFGAANIALGQRVAVDSETQSTNPATDTADKIKLQEQALTGTISALSAGSFVLTPSTTSAFFSLTGIGSVTVNTLPGTVVKGVTLANGGTVTVRGLLFVNGSAYTMIAARITS
ncbi:MAG TPA: DUF5666 domain-containing protein [Terriglobales bacterium]|nr:DUF5666 domain-containing protein [Terriglobales bacterium]